MSILLHPVLRINSSIELPENLCALIPSHSHPMCSAVHVFVFCVLCVLCVCVCVCVHARVYAHTFVHLRACMCVNELYIILNELRRSTTNF